MYIQKSLENIKKQQFSNISFDSSLKDNIYRYFKIKYSHEMTKILY